LHSIYFIFRIDTILYQQKYFVPSKLFPTFSKRI
jgi:hypothetical protein